MFQIVRTFDKDPGPILGKPSLQAKHELANPCHGKILRAENTTMLSYTGSLPPHSFFIQPLICPSTSQRSVNKGTATPYSYQKGYILAWEGIVSGLHKAAQTGLASQRLALHVARRNSDALESRQKEM